ncbi:MAG: ABC transporter ATP-binding protein [Clostridiales bacterium]|nr:ABC transporter ATP-binding protein [Candidatus Crickella merdequi]
MTVCKLEHISKHFRNGETITPLKDINLEISKSEFVVIEGPSGMGKSTLLYVIGTLLKSDGGSLFIDGRNVAEMTDEEQTSLRADKIGFLFQDSNLIQALTLRENLEFAEKISNSKKDCSAVDEYLEKLGLSDRADYLPHQLSGGQKRRAMVARALIKNPMLILADEPTNDLDDVWAGKIIELLNDCCRNGASVVMVTHDEKWTTNATRKYSLEDGILVKL